MKTTAISKIAKVTCLVTITLAATFQIQSARAIPVMYTLTLTEVSSTVLTYSYNNPLNLTPFTITPINPDAWKVTIDPQSNITLFPSFTFDFAEGMAEPANEVNRIQGGSGSPWFNSFFVNSDLPLGTGQLADSPTIGTDNGHTIILHFIDNAAAGETATAGVPDSGATFTLFASSLIGLLSLRRVRRLQAV